MEAVDEQCNEGHTIEGVDVQESAYHLLPKQLPLLPAMCHGTSHQATPSIQYSGMSPAGRQSVMFSIFPHWDARIGTGQRSNQGESTAIVRVSTDLALVGDGANNLPPLRPYWFALLVR